MANTQKIKVNGVEHAYDDLSDEAKGQLNNMAVTDQEINNWGQIPIKSAH